MPGGNSNSCVGVQQCAFCCLVYICMHICCALYNIYRWRLADHKTQKDTCQAADLGLWSIIIYNTHATITNHNIYIWSLSLSLFLIYVCGCCNLLQTKGVREWRHEYVNITQQQQQQPMQSANRILCFLICSASFSHLWTQKREALSPTREKLGSKVFLGLWDFAVWPRC